MEIFGPSFYRDEVPKKSNRSHQSRVVERESWRWSREVLRARVSVSKIRYLKAEL